MGTCALNHMSISFYFLSNIVLYTYLDVDRVSIVADGMLLLILQYTYGMIQLGPVKTHHAFQQCAFCDKLTPQHFIHCNKCNKCVDVTKVHWDVLGFCVERHKFMKYIYIVRGMTFVNILLCILLAVRYPWSIVAAFVHLYVLKSTYLHGQRDIYVNNN